MSILSQITRISTNIQNALSIIMNAGVTVADTATSDDLPSLIEELINSGGGGDIDCGYFVELPEGYTQVEYIESTGTQYIDTGFKHNQDTRVVMDIQLTATPTANTWLFEGRNTTGSNCGSKSVFFYATSTDLWTSDYSGSNSRKNFSNIGATDRLRIDYNKNVCTINGQSVTHSELTFQSNYNLYLLADNRAGTVTGPASAKLYSCQIYDNGTLVRDFIPCVNSSGIAGLYDLANSAFYSNAGTGAFVTGAEIITEQSAADIDSGTF